jgi:hypothetical protein
MSKFKNWLNLNEGMTVHVQGYSEQENIRDLDSLCEKIKNKFIYPLLDKLTPEAKESIDFNHGILTPDGSYYSEGKEVLNLYTDGWGDLTEKLVQGVKYFLDEFGVKYGTFKEEKSGMFKGNVFRIPVLKWQQTKNIPPTLNLNNMNANLIFSDLLGYKYQNGGYFGISPADLNFRIANLDPEKISVHARDPYSSQKQKGPLFFQGGIDKEQIKERLQRLQEIAKWALANHYDSIDVS